MNVLMINSTNTGLDIELFCNEKLKKNHYEDVKHSETIIVSIDKILRQEKLKPADLNVVAICVGPGSFTGIRVSLAVAKAFAVASNVKLVSFTSFELASYNNLDYDAVIIRGFSNFYYIKTKNIQECLAVNDIASLTKDFENIICENDIAQKLNIKNNCPNVEMWPVVKQKIEIDAFTDLDNLDALYLRLSQAELTKEGKK